MLLWCLTVRPTSPWVTAIVSAIGIVIAAELANTAVEHLVDLVSGEQYHTLAGSSKDAAAGCVLVCSVASIFVGIAAGVETWPWHFALLTNHHAFGALEASVGLFVLLLWIGQSIRLGRYKEDKE